MRCLRWRAVVWYHIFSLKLFVFIFFINRLFLNCMISNTMRSYLPFFFDVFPGWLRVVSIISSSLGDANCNLRLINIGALRHYTLPVLFIVCDYFSGWWFLFISGVIFGSIRVISSTLLKIRPHSHGLVIWLSCLLASGVLLRRCISLVVGRWQRTRLIGIGCVLTLIMLA